jgi:hypothetical protein
MTMTIIFHLQDLILDVNREIRSSNKEKHTSTQGMKKVGAYNINK